MKKYIAVLIFMLCTHNLFAQTKEFTIHISIEDYTVTFEEKGYKEVIYLTLQDWLDFTTEKRTCLKLKDGRIIYHTVLHKNVSYIQKWDLIDVKKERDNCDCVYDYRVHK